MRYWLIRRLMPKADRAEIVFALEYLAEATAKAREDLKAAGEEWQLQAECTEEVEWLDLIADRLALGRRR